MIVQAIKCPKCGDIIYSRAIHDYHSCSCGAITIDGGFDYCHTGWTIDLKMPELFQINIPKVTEQDLYNDWNYRKNQYGRIKGGRKFWFKFLKGK